MCKQVFLVHPKFLTHHLNEQRVVVFGAVFGQHLGESHFRRIEFGAGCKPFMIQFVVVKGFDERAHFIELPYLFLKRDAVNVVGQTHVVQRFLVQFESLQLMRLFCKRVHHIFVPEKTHYGAIRFIHERRMFRQFAGRVYQPFHNGLAVFIVGFRLKNGLNEFTVVIVRIAFVMRVV